MKKFLLSLVALAFTITASAQYYHTAPVSGSNPNNVNQENSEYPVGSGLPTDWTSIVGAAQSAGVGLKSEQRKSGKFRISCW